MKAKEYVDELKRWAQETAPMDAVAWLGAEFLRETGRLAKARNCQSEVAVLGVLKTQQQKWEAVCRLVPGLKEDGYLMLIRSEAPLLYVLWLRYEREEKER